MNAAHPKAFLLPNGRAVSIASYVAAWRTLKKLHASHNINGWDDWGTTAGEILHEMREGVEDRINLRGNLPLRPAITPTRLRRRMAGRIKCECRWCGSTIPYAEHANRFCDAGCRHDYYY